MSSLSAALTALYERVPLGMRLGLEPMRAACMRANHPERAFEAVHIAGTNGKGSTCAMVESIARASGLKTGMYTSPHLCRFAERIRINGVPLEDEALTRVLDDALRIGSDLSFFETATLAAFLAFREAKVDLAIIEVGIGGRLDATTVIPPPKCAAIVSIGFDHQDKLGDSLDAIAREKASIAKRGAPIVLGSMPEEARRAAREVIAATEAHVVDLKDLPATITVGLEGDHQRANAQVAWTIASELELPDIARARGLANARWPGRLERIEVTEGELAGAWILDGAHNPDGAHALVAALDEEHVGAVIFGALADKAWVEMLGILSTMDAPRFYVEPPGRAPASPLALAAIAPGHATASIDRALSDARRLAKAGGVVVVCGSLYLVGEARARLLDLPTDPVVAM